MSKTKPRATNAMVIRAIYDLGDRYSPTWPTAARIASFLEVDEEDVRACLRDLRSRRLFRDRRRKGKTVWVPWEEA